VVLRLGIKDELQIRITGVSVKLMAYSKVHGSHLLLDLTEVLPLTCERRRRVALHFGSAEVHHFRHMRSMGLVLAVNRHGRSILLVELPNYVIVSLEQLLDSLRFLGVLNRGR